MLHDPLLHNPLLHDLLLHKRIIQLAAMHGVEWTFSLAILQRWAGKRVPTIIIFLPRRRAKPAVPSAD
jgi:hypothetical protein